MKLRSGKDIHKDDNDITVTITKFTMTDHGYYGITDCGEKAYVPKKYVPYGHKIKKLGVSYKAYLVRKVEGLYNIYSLTPNKGVK